MDGPSSRQETASSRELQRAPRLPPRWLVRSAWLAHRTLYRTSGGRVGLRRPTPTLWGMMRLRTIGRRSGEERSAILGYYEDGRNLVTLAMNGWADAEPAWWLNLQDRPDAAVDLVDGPRTVRAREAEGEERSRLWARWRDVGDDVDAYAKLRSSRTAVVVLEPRPGPRPWSQVPHHPELGSRRREDEVAEIAAAGPTRPRHSPLQEVLP